jgi:hypothetical protein
MMTLERFIAAAVGGKARSWQPSDDMKYIRISGRGHHPEIG